MGWKLYDLVNAKNENIVTMWLNRQDKALLGRISAKMQSLIVAEVGLLPNMITDTHEKSIKEMVINGKSGAFRLFLCRGPTNPRAELTFLCGGREKDRKYIDATPEDAEQFRQSLIKNTCTRREHEYFKGLLGRS